MYNANTLSQYSSIDNSLSWLYRVSRLSGSYGLQTDVIFVQYFVVCQFNKDTRVVKDNMKTRSEIHSFHAMLSILLNSL